MVERLPIAFAGQNLHLLADRAIYWPAQDTLIIADLHLGKGETFRSFGIAVPRGGTDHDLQRLARLIAATGAARLLILGDVLHGARTQGDWLQDWCAFLAAHPTLAVEAVIGNHDRAINRASLDIALLGEQVEWSGIALCHEAPRSGLPSISGHIHPVVKLPGEPRRIPVFWQHGAHLILPAFSAFTGGYLVRRQKGHALYACNGEQIVAL
jgi:DNA ligase-associated metallophosphoesterase